jgi:23S rRNA (guanosine2251-2'-O)-methyltransferase
MTSHNSKKKPSTSWIYGLNPVLEALRAGHAKTVYVSAGRRKKLDDIRAEAEKVHVTVKVIHDPGFFDTRFPKGHQGVAAEAESRPGLSLEEFLEIPVEQGETPFFIVLDLIEDPRNVGAIIRSAEAAGAHGVVMQERRQAGLGPEVSKASAGALEHMAVAVVPNIKHAISRMKDMGISVVGAEPGHHPPPWEAGLKGPLALVIGSEGKGLRKTVREKCDLFVALPVRGKVSSLNTSVAAGILIYEVLRQRD